MAASAGDKRAADELVRRYKGTVERYTLYHLGRKGCNLPADHSPAIINAALLIITVRGNQLKDCDKFDWWVNKVISRLVSKHASGPNGCRRRQKQIEQLDPTRPPRIEPTYEIIEAGLFIKELLNRADEQSPVFGRIVRLHLIEGHTLRDVAQQLGQPYTKLRSFYYRHLYVFRKFIKGGSEGDGVENGGEDGGGDSDDSHLH